MRHTHARVPAPEIYHLLDWTDADGIDEGDGAGFGEGGPFGVFSGHEEVEGELFAHLGGMLVVVWEHFGTGRNGWKDGRLQSWVWSGARGEG